MLLWYENANGVRLDLNVMSENLKLDHVVGAGMPMLDHRTVRTPTRDGQVYLHTYLESRFVTAIIRVVRVCSWGEIYETRRRIISRLNPKLGVGTLWYSPDNKVLVSIPALVERGCDFTQFVDGYLREIQVGFRCPHPAWRLQPVNAAGYPSGITTPTETTQLLVTPGGISVPVSVPVSVTPTTVVAI